MYPRVIGAELPNTVPYALTMNPLRSRLWRTMILFLLGIGLSFLLGAILVPFWPEFCKGTIVGATCDPLATRTAAGYLLIALGILTVILGPIAGSMIDVALNGAKWETPRGTETVITTMPILIGAMYLILGVIVAATA